MLTKRQKNIVDALPICEVLADVGCDHGYIGSQALLQNKARRVVFTDISQSSLNKARLKYSLRFGTRATFVCQDGVQSVYCNCAVIAGMGGLEIISIIKQARMLPAQLVLQPMRNQQDVRRFLNYFGYTIKLDYTFVDGGKFYDLIVAEQSHVPQQLTPLQYQFGLTNITNPSADFAQFVVKQHALYSKILQSCNDQEVVDKLDLVKQALRQIEENGK